MENSEAILLYSARTYSNITITSEILVNLLTKQQLLLLLVNHRKQLNFIIDHDSATI